MNKIMTIKEKAKAYDELKVKAQKLEEDGCFDKITLFDLFPELKESEDERIIERIKKAVESYWSDEPLNEILSWLEKQGEQKPTEWTYDDEEELKIALNTLEEAGQYSSAKWLKNVCLVPQPKQEWNEEDEKILSDIIKDLVHPWNEYIPDRIEDEIKWLKNRFKSLRPQSHWKPSDEQMKTLEYYAKLPDHSKVLLMLYNDLKKIMEE